MIIHEDPDQPRGQARLNLDWSEIWCNPADAPAIRENQRTDEEFRAELDRQVAEAAERQRTAELRGEIFS